MILMNFQQKLKDDQLKQIEALAGEPIEHHYTLRPQFNMMLPLAEQVKQLMDQVDLSVAEYQTKTIALILPEFPAAAVAVLAYLYHHMERFPKIVRLHHMPSYNIIPRQEVIEILNLDSAELQ